MSLHPTRTLAYLSLGLALNACGGHDRYTYEVSEDLQALTPYVEQAVDYWRAGPVELVRSSNATPDHWCQDPSVSYAVTRVRFVSGGANAGDLATARRSGTHCWDIHVSAATSTYEPQTVLNLLTHELAHVLTDTGAHPTCGASECEISISTHVVARDTPACATDVDRAWFFHKLGWEPTGCVVLSPASPSQSR